MIFAIWYFTLGSLAFLIQYNFVNYEADWITDFYYLWQALKNLFFMLAVFKITEKDVIDIKSGRYNYVLYPITIYFATLCLWGLIKPVTNLAENHPLMVSTTFAAALTGVVIFLIADLRKRSKEI